MSHTSLMTKRKYLLISQLCGIWGVNGDPCDRTKRVRLIAAGAIIEHGLCSKNSRRLNEIYAKHTGQPVEAIEKALDRDYFLTAEEAKTFGLLDQVFTKRPAALDPSKGD